MMMTSLNDLYYRLLERPDETTGLARVPPYGFTNENISYCLVLSAQGELVDVQDIRDTSDKKPKPRRLGVPQAFKRPGTIPKPFYLWDKTSYVLGIEGNKDKATAKETPWMLAEKTHLAFKQHHLKLLKNETDSGLQAICRFLERWQPEQFAHAPFTTEHLDANVVFKLDGDNGYIHQRPAAQTLWLTALQPNSEKPSNKGMCLVSGENAHLSRLHPAIKGVFGGQSSGCSIVSFNNEAFESFGKQQGDNAPVSEKAAFAYTATLNYLLRRENGHCISIGDTSTVFWAQAKDAKQEQEAVALFNFLINLPSDESQSNQVRLTLEKIASGKPFQEIAPDIAGDTRFFVLGLAPNASRLSIRYWLNSSLGELGENLSWHWKDMQIEPLPWKLEHPPSIWQCLIETAVLHKSENIPPQLAGELLRSILTGQRYPRALLVQLVLRMRAGGETNDRINGRRVALVKAVLQRDFRKGFLTKEVPMALDIENAPLAYRLGCLFAVLERVQHGALGDVNASIVDRYYGTASSVPYSVFPRLIASGQNHLSKIKKDKPGFAVNLEKTLQIIFSDLPANFPKQLTIEQQGQFAVGYYHQKQDFFTKKDAGQDTE